MFFRPTKSRTNFKIKNTYLVKKYENLLLYTVFRYNGEWFQKTHPNYARRTTESQKGHGRYFNTFNSVGVLAYTDAEWSKANLKGSQT
jgi:hypothetical protein